MKYSIEEVQAIFNKVLTESELDLVHHIKHSKEDSEKSVAKLRVLDLIARGINHRLEEELNGQ